MAAQAVGIAQGCHTGHQEIVMLIYGMEHGCIERKELEILVRGLSRREKVDTCVGDHGPVAMLPGPVNPLKRLLVEEHLEMVPLGYFLHYDHEHHVLVDGLGRAAEHRSALELIWSHFVVPCLEKYAELVSLGLEILHEGAYPGRDSPEVMVFKLLVLGGSVPDDSAAAQHQVRSCIVQGLVHQEILLLEPQIDRHALH